MTHLMIHTSLFGDLSNPPQWDTTDIIVSYMEHVEQKKVALHDSDVWMFMGPPAWRKRVVKNMVSQSNLSPQ